MCESCSKIPFDFASHLEQYQAKLDDMERLMAVSDQLAARDRSFAESLITQFTEGGALSAKQWEWVPTLADRAKAAEPLYGNFKALWVAFMFAGSKLQVPKIRLLASDDTFVQLNFHKAGSRDCLRVVERDAIKVFVGGWAGHGRRLFAGSIEGDVIKPFMDRMPAPVRNVIQDLALDPMGVAKAMAARLGVCLYCGSRLSDEESKKRGYGPTCAENYNMPWGNKRLDREVELAELAMTDRKAYLAKVAGGAA